MQVVRGAAAVQQNAYQHLLAQHLAEFGIQLHVETMHRMKGFEFQAVAVIGVTVSAD